MATTAYIDPGQTDDRVDASQLTSVLARRWPSIAIWLVVALAAALAYVVLAVPIYRASTSILLDPRGGAALSSPEVNTARLSQDVNLIESQVRLVSSPAVLARVVESQRLVDDPEFNEPRRPPLARVWDLVGLKPPEAPAVPQERQVLATLAEHLDVKRSERTLIIDIEVGSRDPAKAARLADAVATAFVEDQLAAKAQAAGREGGRLDVRLRELEESIRAGERKIEAFRAKNPILVSAGGGGLIGEQQLLELNSALLRARTAMTEGRARLDQVERATRSGKLDTLPESLRSGVIGTLRSQYADAERRSQGLGTNLGPRHPEFIEAQRQLGAMQALISDELRRVAAGLRSELEVAQAAEAAAKRALDARQRELASANEARADLRSLERAVQTDKATYDRLLSADNTLQQEGGPTPIARPLAPALLPLRPATPNARAILIIAAALGLAFGLAMALLREHRARVKASRAMSAVPSRAEQEGTPVENQAFVAPEVHKPAAETPAATDWNSMDLSEPVPKDRYVRRFHLGEAMRPAE